MVDPARVRTDHLPGVISDAAAADATARRRQYKGKGAKDCHRQIRPSGLLLLDRL
jgi:hypothetical protein